MRIASCCVLSLVLAGTAAAQEVTTYTYDVHGRLAAASRSTGPNTTYAYDGGDSRTSRVTVGGSSLMAEPDAVAAADDVDPPDADDPSPDNTAQDD